MDQSVQLSPLLDIDEQDEGTDSATTDTDYDDDEKKEHDDAGDTNYEPSTQIRSGIGSKLRKLPPRSTKLKSHSLRTSMKPPKVVSKKLNFSQIEKLYTNQKLKKRHTNLETIFEEPQSQRGRRGEDAQYRLIGSTKHKRFLKCCDGLNVNKQLIKHRRAMVKKNFGRRRAGIKLTMDSFLQHFNRHSNSEGEEAVQEIDSLQPVGSETVPKSAENVLTEVKEEEMEN